VTSAPAFIDGYHAGLLVTIALVAVGAIVGYAALRRAAGAAPAPVPVPAAEARPASGTELEEALTADQGLR
jgi:hypothetical protein